MFISTVENWIVDDMTNKQVRYIDPVRANQSTGRVGQLYTQIRRDFQLVPPLTLFSPSPRLLAGVWSIWRESQFAEGTTPRATLEAISASVSRLNECPYCVDAHTGMLHASSKHDVVDAIFEQNYSLIDDKKTRQIVEWAIASKTPSAKILDSPPFSAEEAPAIIGTTIVYHFVNRMVNIFLETSPLPIPRGSKKIRRLAVRLFGLTLAKSIINRRVIPGDSIKFISQADLPADMRWAETNKYISSAFAGFSHLIGKTGEQYLPPHVLQIVEEKISSWHGEDMGLGQKWMDDLIANLDKSSQPVARLTLLSALAPHQVDANVIEKFRENHADDEALLSITAWASFTAARRIGSWLTND